MRPQNKVCAGMKPRMRTRLTQCLFISLLITSGILAPRSIGQSAAPQNVAWTNATNCTITGNSLQKTAGRSDSSDAGARSQQVIASGDAYLEFTAGDPN